MNNLSEEEIIQHFEFIKSGIKEETKFIDISILEYFEGLLDLYKEKNKQIQVEIEGRNILVGLNENLKKELKKEKEKNANLLNLLNKSGINTINLVNDVNTNYISKDKIKEIIYPTPTNPISYEIQTSDMYRKILQLLEEE